MELIEGETLKGPLSIDTALEAAHERGIIHRDLKPGNIRVTPQSVVKVLDLGLAKRSEAPMADPENAPTMKTPTPAGMTMGTAAYMSPEQARDKTVDKRAEIWAFGVVMYEMVTGKSLFKGEDAGDTSLRD
jgi:serine/threonine protein kinase